MAQGADIHFNFVDFLVSQGANVSLIRDHKLRKQRKNNIKCKEIMDSCIQQIHFDPNLERTKSEQIEEFEKYKIENL